MMRQRDEYVDVAKGIAILMIVCIHTEVFGVFGYPLTFIAVPVFFFMSGFYDRTESGLKVWLPKVLKTLIFPAVIWIVLATVYVQFLGYMKDRSLGDIPFDWYHIAGNNGPAWFLFALLYAKTMLWGLQKARMPKWLVGGVIMAVGYLGMNIDLPLYVGQGCAALPFYAAGKYAYPYMKKLSASKTLLVAGGMAMLAYCCGYASLTIVPQGEGLYAPFYLIALFSMLLVFSPFLYVSSMLQGQKWLGSLGKHSLGIMLLHAPMCHTAAVMLNRIFDKGSSLWVCSFLVAYVLVVFVAYKLTVLMERYCPVLLGKRRAGC